jgi:hypothetical protein
MRTSKELSFYTRVQGFKELLLYLVILLLCLVIFHGISRTQGVIPYYEILIALRATSAVPFFAIGIRCTCATSLIPPARNLAAAMGTVCCALCGMAVSKKGS